MYTIVILTLLLTIPASLSALSANFAILQYDPLQFKLTFTQQVQKPLFQLLYNNIHTIPYSILTNSTISSQFTMEADTSKIDVGSQLQTYTLMFNNPLSIGDGSLQLQDFTLQAEKIPVALDISTYLGIFILIGAYFFNLFTETGTLLIEFVHVCVLYMFQNNTSAGIYREIFIGTLMLPPAHVLQQQTLDQGMFTIVCLAFPPLLLLFFGIIGVLAKKVVPKERSVFCNLLYEQLVFSAFFRTANIFTFNLLYNPIQYALLSRQRLTFLEPIKSIAGILVYLNLMTFAFIVYLKILVLNPRVGQSAAKYAEYLQSEDFRDFRLLHEKVHLKRWYKRNFAVLGTIKNGLIALIFFWGPMFKYLILLLQFMHIFLIFTLIPFKDDFYRHIKVVCRLLFFLYYSFIVLIYLYFSMGTVNFNFSQVHKVLTGQVSLFIVLLVNILILIFIEVYFKCSNLNYHIKVVKEAHLYKLELIEKKEKQDNEQNMRKIKKTKFSGTRSKTSSKAADLISDVGSPDKHIDNEVGLRKELLGDGQKQKVRSGRKRDNVEIEMVNLSILNDAGNSRQRTRTEEHSKRRKKKSSEGTSGKRQ